MNIKYKLTSRKFWVAVADFVGMLLVFLNYPQDRTTQVVALIMAGAGVIAYIIGEGLTDMAAVENKTTVITETKEVEDDGTDKA